MGVVIAKECTIDVQHESCPCSSRDVSLKAKMVHGGKSWSGYCGNLCSKQELEVVFILDSY